MRIGYQVGNRIIWGQQLTPTFQVDPNKFKSSSVVIPQQPGQGQRQGQGPTLPADYRPPEAKWENEFSVNIYEGDKVDYSKVVYGSGYAFTSLKEAQEDVRGRLDAEFSIRAKPGKTYYWEILQKGNMGERVVASNKVVNTTKYKYEIQEILPGGQGWTTTKSSQFVYATINEAKSGAENDPKFSDPLYKYGRWHIRIVNEKPGEVVNEYDISKMPPASTMTEEEREKLVHQDTWLEEKIPAEDVPTEKIPPGTTVELKESDMMLPIAVVAIIGIASAAGLAYYYYKD